MKLEDLEKKDVLQRPKSKRRTITDGAYQGVIASAAFEEKESKFSEDGTRVVLNLKIEVEDDAGEIVELYLSPNFTWSKRGHMIKILEKLEALPAPGESIRLDELVGIPAQVIVENVQKDTETYSNIVSIKKIKKQVPNGREIFEEPAPLKQENQDFNELNLDNKYNLSSESNIGEVEEPNTQRFQK